jgi:hypothetical protein
MDTEQHEESTPPASDLLIGGKAIKKFVVEIGLPPKTDPYYLKKIGWPIGRLHGDTGALVATKPRLLRHVQKNAAGKITAA